MSDIRTVEFNALPKNVRERFAAITIGTSGPAPLLAERTSTGTKIVGPVFGALVLLVLVIGLLGGGAGDLYNNLAIHGPLHVLLGYAPLLFVLALAILAIVHRKRLGSPFPFQPGRYLFATGRNSEAARYAGINTRWTITIAYVIAGALTAVSGIMFAFYTNSVSPANHGNAYELYGIAAAVLGGCSLRGGEGSVIGIIFGAALLQVLRNLVNLLGIPSSLDFAVMGAVILIGVMADQILSERRNRRRRAVDA